MRLYHQTRHADRIKREGFQDGPASFSKNGALPRGVWLADRPMSATDFSHLGDEAIVLEIPAEVVAPFEQPDDDLGLPDDMPYYRAFVVPAEIVNRYNPEGQH